MAASPRLSDWLGVSRPIWIFEKMTANGPQGQTAFPAEVARLCAIAGLSRASFYRSRAPKLTQRDDADLCDLIERLALQRRSEGTGALRAGCATRASSSTPNACCG